MNAKEPAPWLDPENNAALARRELEEGKTLLASTPQTLTLETTSRCNLRCVMCSHAWGEVDRPKHLDEQLTKKLGRYLGQACAVQLHGIGEPTNSPSFWSALSDLPDPKICESSINSNFTVISENQIKRLIDSNLKLINVSLDAATPETYRKIRGFDFDRVLGNIRCFVQERASRGKRFPLLYLNMTLMRANIEELVMFIRLAKDLGAAKVCAWHLNRWPEAQMNRYVVRRDDWTFEYSKEGLWNYPELSNEWIGKAEAEARTLGIDLWLPTATRVYFDKSATDTM